MTGIRGEDLLHDAELVTISVAHADSTARLEFRHADASCYRLNLYGLRAIRCVDMTMQNVVYRLLQSSNGTLAVDEWERWLEWVTSFSDGPSWLTERARQDLLASLTDKSVNLLVIESSLGATVASVCARMELQLS